MSVPERPPPDDLYAVLGVDRGASRAEIESAFRAQAKRHHPDVAIDAVAATAQIKRINLARHWLVDPARRLEYNRQFGWDRVEIRTDWQPPPMTADDLLRVQYVRRRRRQPNFGGIVRLAGLFVVGGVLLAISSTSLAFLGTALIFSGIVGLLYGGVGLVVGIVMRRRLLDE